jgi:predicted transcriptional regulator
MSVQAISWALNVSTGDTGAKCLLLALANYADENGECWPSQERLARDTELTDRTVRTKLKLLEECGLIRREHRCSDAGWRTSDYYRLYLGQSERFSGEAEAPTGNPCIANRKSASGIEEPSEEPSFTEAKASVRDLKTELVWRTCPGKLVRLGMAASAARSNLGRWLKDADPDRVLEAVDAADRVGTQDSAAYITAALKPKESDWKREGAQYFVRGNSQLADEWRSYGCKTNQGDLAYLPKDEKWHRVPRRFPNQRSEAA